MMEVSAPDGRLVGADPGRIWWLRDDAQGVRPYEKPHYASGVTWNGTAITLTIRSTMLANQTRSRMDRPMSFRAVMPDSAQAVIRVYGKIRDVRERP